MTKITPGEIRERLDALIASADPLQLLAFADQRQDWSLSDGTLVGYDREPGWLRINGQRRYSAAWL